MTITNLMESKLFNLVSWIAAATGFVAVGIAIALQISGLHVVIVQTGSMNPVIPAGSVVLTKSIPASAAQIGDVLTIRQPNGGYVTHRLVSMRPAPGGVGEVVQTRGDANLTNDPLPLTVQNVNKVQASIPGAGKIIDALSSKIAAIIFGSLIIAGLAVVWHDISNRDENSAIKRRPFATKPDRAPEPAPVRVAAVSSTATRPVRHTSPARVQRPEPRARVVEVTSTANQGQYDPATIARIVAIGMTHPEVQPAAVAARLMGIPEDEFISPDFIREVMSAVQPAKEAKVEPLRYTARRHRTLA